MRIALQITAALLLAPIPPLGVGDASAQERARIVVLQASDLQPFRDALRSLRDALGRSVDVVVLDLDPTVPDAPEELAEHAPDVIVTLGSEATDWAKRHTRDVPVVFAMVLNPVSRGLVQSMRRPGGRVTGASLDIPADRHFRTLRTLLGARRVAVLYNPKLSGPIVQEALLAARRLDVELVPIEVATTAGLEAALDRVDGSFDALWSIADPTVFGRGTTKRVLLHTIERRIPFMGLSEQYVRAGALIALSVSYEENGRLAAKLVERVLAGESPDAIPIATPIDVEITYNPRTAERLHLDLRPVRSLHLRSVE